MLIEEYLKTLEKFAPLSLSEDFVCEGAYDNSGLLIKTHNEVNKVLFCLDLSPKSVEYAHLNGFDTVVTHHPVIYNPVKRLIVGGENSTVTEAVKNGLNVISMHLNLDIADGGIDDSLAKGLGGKKLKTVKKISGNLGYGKEFDIEETSFFNFVAKTVKTFSARNVLAYGDDENVKTVASFCGGGSSEASEYSVSGKADVIVTSDVPHHVIKAITENGKKLLILSHYSAEIYGFTTFFEKVKGVINSKIFKEDYYL